MKGQTWELVGRQDDHATHFSYYFDGCESVVLHLTPGQSSVTGRQQKVLRQEYKQVQDVSCEENRNREQS